MCQDTMVNASDLFNKIGEDAFGANGLPVVGKEDNGAGSDEFLQSPAALEPCTSSEGRGELARVLVLNVWNVMEEGVAHSSAVVPSVHGVDSF